MTHSSRTHTTALGLGCLTLLGIATAASAAPTGFEFEATTVDQSTWAVGNQDARDLVSVKVYIAFDDPLDQLVIVNGKPGANISVSTDDLLGFFQSAVGSSNTSETRTSAIIAAFPCAGADSYVSIGLLNNDSGTDAIITTGMDWATFNGGGALESLDTDQGGGWLVTPDDHQGDATDGHVFIGQFTVASGSTVTATLNYMYVDNATSTSIEIDGAAFTTTATPEAMMAKSDFNGDGQSDLLWQGAYGAGGAGTHAGSVLSWINWDGSDLGYDSNFVYNCATSTPIPEDWTIAGTGDMNSDGRSDIVWRDGDGSVIVWFMEADGYSYTSQWLYSGAIAGWSIRALGDLNGDGQADILWQGIYGAGGAGAYEGSLIAWTNWDGSDNGYESNFVYNTNVDPAIPEEWIIVGTGDMNTNGRGDIIWRDGDGSVIVWFMEADGYSYTSQWLYSGAIAGWSIVGLGDLNGDDQTDLLWQGIYGAGGAGAYEGSLIAWTNWDGSDNGYDTNFVYNTNVDPAIPSDWSVASTGDMNANGRDDIIWRNGVGSVIVWEMDANGYDYVSEWLYNNVISGWNIKSPRDIFTD